MPVNSIDPQPFREAGVISQIGDTGFDPVGAQQKAYSLKDLMNREQVGQLQLNQLKQADREKAAIDEIKRNSRYNTDQGVNETAEKIARVSPDAAMRFKSEMSRAKMEDLELKDKQFEVAGKQAGVLAGSIDHVLAQVEPVRQRVQAGQATQAELDAATMRAALPEIQRLQSNPDVAKFAQEFIQNPKNLTYSGLRAVEAQSQQGRALLAQHHQELQDLLAQRREDTSERREATSERRADAYERRVDAMDRRTNDEAGANSKYEWVDPRDHSKGVQPVKGGAADTEKPMTGREAQMFGRIVTSANLGVQALKNVVELPVGASTGLFGVGGGPGKSLLESAKGALTNKLASQDVQDYNVMIAGLSRNLSTMETSGLAPGANFTESFNAVQLKEGDTQFTKLRKLAESRQILEKGLEPAIDNPRVPAAQKAEVRKLIADVQQAVPYDQHDLTVLRRIQSTHPGMTLQDVIKAKGLDKSSQAAPSAGWGEAQIVQ